jgi:hypothetical protein
MGGSIRLRIANSLGLLYLPTITAPRSSLLRAGVWLCLTHADTQMVPAGDPCPSFAMQQQIPGLLPGTGANRFAVLQSIEVLGNRVGCLAAAALRLS